MKVGDLVRDNSQGAWAHAAKFGGGFKHGVILGFSINFLINRPKNNEYRVLWSDGTIDSNVCVRDLRMVSVREGIG